MRSEHSIETQEWMKRKRDEGKRRLFHLEIENEELEAEFKMSEFLEIMNIAKSRNGMIGKDRTLLDEEGAV